VLANPSDEVSLLRIINTPSRGIGTATIEALLDYAVKRGKPLWNELEHAVEELDLAPGAAQRVEGFRRLIESYRARVASIPLTELLRELLGTIEYRTELERLHPGPGEAEARWSAVEGLVNAAALYEQREENPNLLGFLEQASLGERDDFDDDKKERHAVTLMTLHSAKGLEFPYVYMVGLEEGILPHQRSILEGKGVDEERRLCYVGVTRAQDVLTLTFAKARMKWGKPRPSIPSRFLMEMRGDTERARRAAAAAEALYRNAAEQEAKKEEAKKDAKKTASTRRKPNTRSRSAK
jgi:DNA helicase-2/ATP-dependent DNA helicase PcrA